MEIIYLYIYPYPEDGITRSMIYLYSTCQCDYVFIIEYPMYLFISSVEIGSFQTFSIKTKVKEFTECLFSFAIWALILYGAHQMVPLVLQIPFTF